MSPPSLEPREAGMTMTFAARANSRPLRRVMLKVVDGPDQGTQIQFARPRLTIGRSAVADLVLTDSSISGLHAELLLGPTGVLLRDLKSTNGTTIHGVRIQEAWVEPGMTLVLGKTQVAFLAEDSVDVPLSGRDHFGALLGQSPAMREVYAVLERVAATEMSVMIGGETGAGKELVARALHDESPRHRGPFVVLDCGALPRELAEAAILGHKKGAFTGAMADRAGCFEDASGGTLFLDEIGELPLDLQPKLLRVLDRREVQRIGESTVRKVDVRVVAATHRDLKAMVSAGSFREDLYFRLSVMTVELPPLRERGDDIVLLAEKFIADTARRLPSTSAAPTLSPAARQALLRHPWPGNVRELKNTLERATYLARGVIEPADLFLGRAQPAPTPAPAPAAPADQEPLYALPFKEAKQTLLDGFETRYFSRLLEAHDHNLSRAAAAAGITRYYLRELLKRLGLHRTSAADREEEP
ncbi:MAG: sigma 54-interacting transcriptional regulator [Myxococcales bacterium]|nr:sigma 54-interacting transcriptional regulator [Myxococcales bacterium]